MNRRIGKWIAIIILAPIGFAVFLFVGGEAVKLLWNWLLPPLVRVPEITFWQALGLLALCRILFGGFGMHSGPARSRFRRRRWEHMTPEERERFRYGMRGRWCMDSPAAGAPEGGPHV